MLSTSGGVTETEIFACIAVMKDAAQGKYPCSECAPLHLRLQIVVSVVFGKVGIEQLVLCSLCTGVHEILAAGSCPGKILLFC